MVKETGSYRFKRGENLEIFEEMFPGLPKVDEGYKLHLSKCEDTFHEVATFGDGTTFNTTWKYDVETPFLGMLDNSFNHFSNLIVLHYFYHSLKIFLKSFLIKIVSS